LATSIFRPFVFLLPKTFNDKTLKYCWKWLYTSVTLTITLEIIQVIVGNK
jgi:glycopeptide antibiotics resistance protein